MIDYYIEKHCRNGILIDTNLLLLYLVGSYDPCFIKKFKRTHQYSPEEYGWIKIILSRFSKVVITPHILAEVWNFAEKIKDHFLVLFIEKAIQALEPFTEDYISKNEILNDPKSLKLSGVADLSIIIAAKEGNYLILTDDLRAFNLFLYHKVNAINLNHIRTSQWIH